MPRGGQNAKPAEQRIAEGNKGKRAIPKPAVIGDKLTTPPPAPERLSTEARAAWGNLARILTDAGYLRTGDLDAFESLCDAIGIRRMASKDLNAHFEDTGSFLVQGVRGISAHPSVAIERNAADQVRKWAAHFGLTPSDRTRLGAASPEGTAGEREPEDDLPELALLHGGK